MKKSLVWLLVACMMLSLLPLGALAEGTWVGFNPFPYANVEEDYRMVEGEINRQLAEAGDAQMDWLIVPTDGMLEKLNTMIAGGDQLDVVILNIGDADRYAPTEDLMLPLNDLLEEYGQDLLKNIPEEAWIRSTNAKGEIIYIPESIQWRWQGAVIRTDLLEEQNLEMPTNIAELENVMAVFKEAYPDMIPATGLPWFSDPFLQGAVDSVGSWQTPWALDAEGNVVPSTSLPEYKSMLAMYKKWVDNGWYDAEFYSGNDTTHSQLWTSGRVGIVFCDPHRNLDWNWEAFKAGVPGGTASFIPVLKNEAGVKKFPIDYGVGIVAFIMKDSEYAVDVIKYFNRQAADPDFYFLGANGIEGEHWVDKGDTWGFPEGEDSNNRRYSKLFAPLSYDYMNQMKRMEEQNPETGWVHDALNIEYATAELILTGLEGFTPDNTPVSQYNPFDLNERLINLVLISDASIDEFESVVDEWYNAGGREIVEEYTRQYNEWKVANGK